MARDQMPAVPSDEVSPSMLQVVVSGRRRSKAIALLVVVAVIAAIGSADGSAGATSASRRATVDVGGVVNARAVPTGFAGLSLEYTTVEDYLGGNPSSIDPVFEQLVRNIAPGQRPVLRIGGDTTDWTWSPISGMTPPPWVRFTLSSGWFGVMQSLERALDPRFIFGVNLEADSRSVAQEETTDLLRGFGPGAIAAFELGNEPELYGSYSWYRTRSGQHITGRPGSYNFGDFTRDFTRIGSAVPTPVALAGPGTGGSASWTSPLSSFLAREPRVKIVTMHRYGLDGCSHLVPIKALLSSRAQVGLVASVARPLAVAHAHHVQLRIEEMNTVACGGQRGVSNTFAAALWLLGTMLDAARHGVDGVNVHTNPLSNAPPTPTRQSARAAHAAFGGPVKSPGLNSLFDFSLSAGVWHASIRPEYYGMLLFAQAAAPGSRFLRTVPHGATTGLHEWALEAPDGTIHVVLENERLAGTERIKIRIPASRGVGALERLSAPGLAATGGVTLGRRGFGPSTTTGQLKTPVGSPVTPTASVYQVELPAASAAMLTVRR